MKKILNIKRIIVFLLILSTAFLNVQCGYAATRVKTKEQARQKINHLKWLEKVEHNKLYKNQQKLAYTASNLEN